MSENEKQETTYQIPSGWWKASKSKVITVAATIVATMTILTYYIDSGLPIPATRIYVDTQAERTLEKMGIDPRVYPNIKFYIDKRNQELKEEFVEKLNDVEDTVINIDSKINLLIRLNRPPSP